MNLTISLRLFYRYILLSIVYGVRMKDLTCQQIGGIWQVFSADNDTTTSDETANTLPTPSIENLLGTWFQVEGILNRFDNEFLKQLKDQQGTDCRVDGLSRKKTAICNDIKIMMKILIGVHLTSFSNKFMRTSQAD